MVADKSLVFNLRLSAFICGSNFFSSLLGVATLEPFPRFGCGQGLREYHVLSGPSQFPTDNVTGGGV
jgi:hypothetical protein